MTLRQSLHACGSRSSIYKCHCRDASTAVAPDHAQMERTWHGKQCNRGKTQVKAVSLLNCGGSNLPLLPHIKLVSLLLFSFLVHHHTVSTKSPQKQYLHFTSNQTTSSFGFKNLWLALFLSRSAFESGEKTHDPVLSPETTRKWG